MKKVLVVDDSEEIRSWLGQVLATLNYDPDTAPDAEEALAKVAKRFYDIVLTDYDMPGMKGDALGERIRATSPHTQVLLMSGNAEVSPMMNAGGRMCLRKPFSRVALKEALDRALALAPSANRAGGAK